MLQSGKLLSFFNHTPPTYPDYAAEHFIYPLKHQKTPAEGFERDEWREMS